MSSAIGDSIRRRHGSPRPTRSAAGVRWGRVALIALGGVLAAFGLGYALAVLVLFPAPPEAAPGIVVPRVVGVDTTFAARTLAARGLRLGTVTAIPDASVAAGMIVAQDALAGQQLRRGATVNVAVSSGPVRTVLPDVTGLAAARAQALLTALGFQVAQQTSPGDRPAGEVLRVEPAAGVAYDVPAQATLIVSTGPPPDSTAVRDSTAAADSAATTPPAPPPPAPGR